ncbi:MAG: GNAT family N-acetyltransferase [Thermoplasmata archaeon]
MKDVVIRSLSKENPERILALWRSARLPHRPKGRDLPTALREEMRSNPDLAIGAYIDSELVGTVLGTDDGRKGWINRLAVDPDYRGRGIGTRLLQEAESALQRRGRRIIAALVEDWNEDSLVFFQSNGYRLHEDIHYMSKRESEDV